VPLQASFCPTRFRDESRWIVPVELIFIFNFGLDRGDSERSRLQKFGIPQSGKTRNHCDRSHAVTRAHSGFRTYRCKTP
jgi:hypothetical protein